LNDQAPRRARSLGEMNRMQAKAFAAEDIATAIAAYRPRPTDIVISPFAKCGTTWLQQTFHCLRTRGDMDFDDISRVTPWIEMSGVCSQDLEAPQRGEPRGFKSHLPYDAIPKGARYVVALRDPKDAMISLYRFMEGWFLEPGAVSFTDFARGRMNTPGPDYWGHLVSWWGQRDNPNVLLLSYEGMTADPEASIRRLATFAGIALDDDLLALTLKHSSRTFMLAHEDRFDDLMMRQASEQRCNLPTGSASAKVRAKPAGPPRQEMTADLEAEMDARWAERVAAPLGFETYAALEAALRAGDA
jgi:hypothetical protein